MDCRGQAKRAAQEASAAISPTTEAGSSKPIPVTKPPVLAAKKQVSTGVGKKDQKTLLKGVIRKKAKAKDAKPTEKTKDPSLIAAEATAPTLPKSSASTSKIIESTEDSKKRRASLVDEDSASEDDKEDGVGGSETKKPRLDT